MPCSHLFSLVIFKIDFIFMTPYVIFTIRTIWGACGLLKAFS